MVSLSCVVIGDSEFPKILGKLGSHTDIEIYNRKLDNNVFSFIYPKTYPEKLSSLLTAISLSDIAIVIVKEVTAEFGETIIALTELEIPKGLIILDGVIEEQIEPIIKNTPLKSYHICEKAYAPVIDWLMKIEVNDKPGSLKLPFDHFFLTKTIGTVGVGKINRGVIKTHDKLTALPIKKEIIVKSLQNQDENVKEAGSGVRVGVALKGIVADELGRGHILTDSPLDFRVSEVVQGDFRVNSFFSQPLEKGQKLQLTIGLQTESVVLKEVEGVDGKERLASGETGTIELSTETGRELVYEGGEKFILFRPELKGLRVVGSGKTKYP